VEITLDAENYIHFQTDGRSTAPATCACSFEFMFSINISQLITSMADRSSQSISDFEKICERTSTTICFIM